MDPEYSHWNAICGQAEARIPSVYSSTFFSRRNISIIDQQSRSFNLAWALHKTRRVLPSHHVAVVGGGVSGLTCAIALAVWSNCLVSVLERDELLLRRFRRAAHRYLHPDLNSRGGIDGYLRYDPRKTTRFPFMNWSGNYAPAFAEELTRKFEHYRAVLNIALYLRTNVGEPVSGKGRVNLPILGRNPTSKTFDLTILATGFGEEQLVPDRHSSDTSYWLSGNPLSYYPSPLRPETPERVLVSGNGDSAVIELAHLLIKGFTHEDIFAFLPSNDVARKLSDVYANKVAQMSHRVVLREHAGLLAWYRSMRAHRKDNPRVAFFPTAGFNFLRDLYSFADSIIEAGSSVHLSDSQLEGQLDRKYEELASVEISEALEDFDLSKIYSAKIKSVMRDDVRVTITGRTPTIYSIKQAPLNWFLIKILKNYCMIEYRQAEIVSSEWVKSHIHCQCKDGSELSPFDRIVTRHGPSFQGYSSDRLLQKEDSASLTNDSGALSPHLRPEWFVGVFDRDTFTNQRLLRAQRRSYPLDDEPDPKPMDFLRLADTALWQCQDTSNYVKACRLFRELKSTQASKQRAIVAKLLALAQRSLRASTKKQRVPSRKS